MQRRGRKKFFLMRGVAGEFSRFFVVGVGATVIHMAVYVLLNAAFAVEATQTVALTLTYATGYVVSFVANYVASLKWTFKTEGSVGKGLGFAFSHVVNAGVHLGLLNLFALLGLGTLMVNIVQGVAPWLVRLLPFLAQAENWLPIPVYMVAVPLNFLMVRFFLRSS